ncbi:MAG: UbiD family decarboxylase [Deltaproteobacteria bacterium]|nr:UbiD family decarboxylase [Deltaproteobacteria bacterium]
MNDDLRDYLGKAEGIDKLKMISGADWNLEIGTISALNLKNKDCPALLFDNIKDYPSGFRVVTCTGSTPSLVSLILNLPVTRSDLNLLGTLREKLPQWESELDRFKPEEVSTGPILENVLSGKDVDLFKFPVPQYHSLDGGRYIGTGHAVITKDPDTGEINLGTYRVQALDSKTAGWYMMPNQHGDIHRAKYHEKGKPCPVAVSVGHHPLIFRLGSVELPSGMEYQYAGAIRGEPVKVIIDEVTGLPIPADSEIVLVGWCPPDKVRLEGPFGEWTGYYGRNIKTPIIEIERIYYRNDPILVGASPGKPPMCDGIYFRSLFRSARLHDELVKTGIPDVKGVWLTKETNGPFLIVVSIKQRFAGHAKQAALLTSQFRTAGRPGRFVVVVDDDIDPTDIADVLWAMGTRVDPQEDIDIIRGAPSTELDPRIPREANTYVNSIAIINACKPFEWKDDFPVSVDLEEDIVEKVRAKWKDLDI